MQLIVGISGASGAVYGIQTLKELKSVGVETHLVISSWGKSIIEQETNYTVEQVIKLAHTCYDVNNMAAAISSGSYRTDGMIIAPCSMKTLAGIANGYTDDLITRAADVTLKEKRKLALLIRETPLSTIHLENMLKLSRLGVIIMPPVPAFYHQPQSIDEIVAQTTGRLLDQFDIETEHLKRWGGKCDG